MAKLTLTDISSGFQSNTAANANNTLIETALENTLSRDGTGPNGMEADLDMNSHAILNATGLTINGINVVPDGTTTVPAASMVFTPYSNLTSTNIQSAIQEEIDDLASSTGDSLVGSILVGTGATLRTQQSKNRDTINVKGYGAICDGIVDDSTALFNANAAAIANKCPLEITGVMYIATSTTITALIKDTKAQLFTTTSTVVINNGQDIRPEWWGADPTNTNDSLAAFNACFATPVGKTILLSGNYKLSTTFTITNAKALTIKGQGAALNDRTALTYNKSSLNFNSITAGTNGLVVNGFRGLILKDFFISHLTTINSGGIAVYINSGSDYVIDNLKVESETGVTGKGIVLGGGTGATSVFQGTVKNCIVYTDGGPAIESAATNTSLTMISCYQIGGYFNFDGTVYSTVISCASEHAPLYGYIITGSTGMTFISCGGEANGRGVFYLQSSSYNIDIQNPFGAGNNTEANTTIGDLVHIDSSITANGNIKISNPSSINPNAATTVNIVGTAGTLLTEISGVSSTRLPNGISGDATWLLTQLTVTGDVEKRTFTPTLVSGWTIVGTPTVTGGYIKRGRAIHFTINISSTTTEAAASSAQISIPWTAVERSSISILDDNNTDYGTGTASGQTLYVRSIAATAQPIRISGTILT